MMFRHEMKRDTLGSRLRRGRGPTQAIAIALAVGLSAAFLMFFGPALIGIFQ